MPNNPRAGQPAAPSDLVDVPQLITAYYSEHPDPSNPDAAGLVRDVRPPRVRASGSISTTTIFRP